MNRGDGTSFNDLDFYPRITCKWISQLLETIANSPFFKMTVNLLKYLFKEEGEKPMPVEKFEKVITECEYLRDMEITKEE